jgi:hypothetical protein
MTHRARDTPLNDSARRALRAEHLDRHVPQPRGVVGVERIRSDAASRAALDLLMDGLRRGAG